MATAAQYELVQGQFAQLQAISRCCQVVQGCTCVSSWLPSYVVCPRFSGREGTCALEPSTRVAVVGPSLWVVAFMEPLKPLLASWLVVGGAVAVAALQAPHMGACTDLIWRVVRLIIAFLCATLDRAPSPVCHSGLVDSDCTAMEMRRTQVVFVWGGVGVLPAIESHVRCSVNLHL